MRKTPLRRKSKTDIAKLKEQLWQLCREFAKNKYKQKDGTHRCFTCDKPIEKANCQLGHFIPNASCGALLRYHPHNLRLQCYYDNINLGGNGSEFYRQLVETEGQAYVDNIFRLKQKTVKADILFYQKLIELYTQGVEKDIIDFLEGC